MRILRKVAGIFDRIDTLLAVVASVLIFFIGLATLYEVVMRYFFNNPTAWTVEVSTIALLYIAFLGAAWVLKTERHVKIDIVLNQLNPGHQALLNMITSVISAIVCLVIAWYGVKATLESFQIGFRLETALQTPQFIVLAVIPVGSFVFFVRFLKRSYGYLVGWRAQEGG